MGASRWTSFADAPPVAPGHCQVWWASPGLARDWHTSLLSVEERERRARLRQGVDRDRSTVACAVLRIVVGRLAGLSPSAVEVHRSCPDCDRPHGKPVVRAAQGLECSVSHAGDRVVVAVARAAPIGVDVEKVDPDLDVDRLAERVLSADEVDVLAGLPLEQRAWGFSTYWTRKEAILKAAGYGLRVAPDQVRVSAPAEPPRLLAVGDDVPFRPAGVELYSLDPGPGYTATLVTMDGPLAAVWEVDAAPLLAAPSS